MAHLRKVFLVPQRVVVRKVRWPDVPTVPGRAAVKINGRHHITVAATHFTGQDTESFSVNCNGLEDWSCEIELENRDETTTTPMAGYFARRANRYLVISSDIFVPRDEREPKTVKQIASHVRGSQLPASPLCILVWRDMQL
jgi:hypothetical protein